MKTIFLAIGLLLISLAGCQQHNPFSFPMFQSQTFVEVARTPTHHIRVAPQFRGTRPGRIMIVPSNKNFGRYDANGRLIEALAGAFRERNMCEVVTPKILLAGHYDNIEQGRFDEREIARISREHNSGAVALVKINEMKLYSPMRASVTIAIVDSNETVVACGLDGIWDLGNTQTNAAFKNFLANHTNRQYDELSLQSPQLLFKFIAMEIANSVNNSGY